MDTKDAWARLQVLQDDLTAETKDYIGKLLFEDTEAWRVVIDHIVALKKSKKMERVTINRVAIEYAEDAERLRSSVVAISQLS
jgi:hypothetical protein